MPADGRWDLTQEFKGLMYVSTQNGTYFMSPFWHPEF